MKWNASINHQQYHTIFFPLHHFSCLLFSKIFHSLFLLFTSMLQLLLLKFIDNLSPKTEPIFNFNYQWPHSCRLFILLMHKDLLLIICSKQCHQSQILHLNPRCCYSMIIILFCNFSF